MKGMYVCMIVGRMKKRRGWWGVGGQWKWNKCIIFKCIISGGVSERGSGEWKHAGTHRERSNQIGIQVVHPPPRDLIYNIYRSSNYGSLLLPNKEHEINTSMMKVILLWVCFFPAKVLL